MVKVISGINKDGSPTEFYVHSKLVETLEIAKSRVLYKNWDYVSIIAGTPGSGKSVLSRTIAKACDPNFTVANIAFSAEEFIEITNKAEKNAAVVLDESFESLNSRVSMSPDFLRVINHLQIIRQKNLFIILCLPNFFDLSKSVAVFRASHLFVTYADDDGTRGKFLAFGRGPKRILFVKGGKYMDYGAAEANYIGKFTKNAHIVDERVYDQMKLDHLMSQQQEIKEKKSDNVQRYIVMWKLKFEMGLDTKRIAELYEFDIKTVQRSIKKVKDLIIDGILDLELPKKKEKEKN